jgi:Chaperone of endosialidase/Concanavalin A-like lectin/glucanases superfamily
MANSITPSGTSRSIFDISISDIVSSGSITASLFKGNGSKLTNIIANSITGVLKQENGGTGNSNYINNGILFNIENKFTNDNNLTWDSSQKKLKINGRDFIEDTSNYIVSTSNKLIDIITQNISLKTNNVSNYVLSTSNVLVKYINKQIEENQNIASSDNLGSVKIGAGIYINTEGVISTTDEVITKSIPLIVNSLVQFEPINGVNYKVCKFLYNPTIGTVFDRINGQTDLPIWYIFTNNYLVINENKIENKGYFSQRLELFGNVFIKPNNIEDLEIEYTPLNTTYLEFTSENNASYCKFEEGFTLNNIYIKPSTGKHSITFSIWLKVNNNNDSITIFEFSNIIGINDFRAERKLKLNYHNNELAFFIDDKINLPFTKIENIYRKRWYHLILSIEKIGVNINIKINIDGINKYNENIGKDILIYLYNLGFENYTINTISNENNRNYNFCISDFKIYNYSLSSEERLEIYDTNKYTKYNIDFQDSETICDILAFGGGGGGSSNYGGGAGKLIYINDAYISSGLKTVKIGRGGSGYNSNINNIQTSFNGNKTTFGIDNSEKLIADGGGSITYPINNDNTYSSIPINNIGGCGSGNNGAITTFNITNDLYNFLGYTSNIYNRGYHGGPLGGGGVGKEGVGNNAGEALYNIDDITNLNTNAKFFNYHNNINFKNDFNLINSDIGELYIEPVSNTAQVYIGCGGYGSSNSGAELNIGYNSINSGSGGNYIENGKNGALLIRVLTKIDRNVIPSYVANTCNYINTTSNNIIEYINARYDSSSVIWVKNNDDIFFGNNVGIGGQSTGNFKLEVSSANTSTTGTDGPFGIHNNQNSTISLTSTFDANICAKFNSGIWASGNIIASSDERIKTNINDISDDRALQMILNIQPKTYNYIDRVTRGNNNIYGFIAQQIKTVIPDAVKIEKEFIPNIFFSAVYNNIGNIIILPIYSINIENIMNKNSKVKCYDMSGNIIIVRVIKIINEYSFKIENINYLNDKIFVYGTEVDDFHVLNKEYINTLNVCAVQELHRKIVLQQNEIYNLNERVNTLIEFIDLSK